MQLLRSRSRTVALNLTPLIDVVLVLIVFFLMTTTFVFSPGIKVDLPPGGMGQQARDSDAIVLITPDGSLFFRDEPVDMQTLRATLSRAREQWPGLRMVIQADKSVEHGRVVEVMEAAKTAGIERLAIGTAPQKGSE